MAIKAGRLRKVTPLAELREDNKSDPLEAARMDGYNQAFKDITERLREIYKTSPRRNTETPDGTFLGYD